MKRATAGLLAALVAAACAEPPANLDPSDIVGRYTADGCPDIVLSKTAIVVPRRSVPYTLIAIKGQSLLSVANGVFVQAAPDCRVVVRGGPLYIPVEPAPERGYRIRISAADTLSETTFATVRPD